MRSAICITLWPVCFCFPAMSAEQQAAPLPPEVAVKSRLFGETGPIAVSPDGKWVAYMIRDNARNRCVNEDETYVRTGLECRVRGGEIWLTSTETSKTRVLTDGSSSSWEPTWSPDGNKLAFLSDRDSGDEAKLWVWDLRKDDVRLVSEARVRASPRLKPIVWTGDSEKILITAVPTNLATRDYADRIVSMPAASGR